MTENRAFRNDDNLGAYETSGVRIDDNEFTDSTFFDGIYMFSDTSNNRIENNFLRGNAEHDCHDDSVGPNNPPALVANFWIDNDGITENRPGLCRAGDGDDDDEDDEDDDDDGDDDDGDDDDDDRDEGRYDD